MNEVEALEKRIKFLKEQINDHNGDCRDGCDLQRATGRCEPYRKLGKNCPDCTRDWLIDLEEL